MSNDLRALGKAMRDAQRAFYDTPSADVTIEFEAMRAAEAAFDAALEAAPDFDATKYQAAEERLCDCGAAGSGEGHEDWCKWVGSHWEKKGRKYDAQNTLEAAERKLAEAMEALKPFARFFKSDKHNLSPAADHMIVAMFMDQTTKEPLAELFIEHFRKAHAALTAEKGDEW